MLPTAVNFGIFTNKYPSQDERAKREKFLFLIYFIDTRHLFAGIVKIVKGGRLVIDIFICTYICIYRGWTK